MGSAFFSIPLKKNSITVLTEARRPLYTDGDVRILRHDFLTLFLLRFQSNAYNCHANNDLIQRNSNRENFGLNGIDNVGTQMFKFDPISLLCFALREDFKQCQP